MQQSTGHWIEKDSERSTIVESVLYKGSEDAVIEMLKKTGFGALL
jgi:hypothetical protein